MQRSSTLRQGEIATRTLQFAAKQRVIAPSLDKGFGMSDQDSNFATTLALSRRGLLAAAVVGYWP